MSKTVSGELAMLVVGIQDACICIGRDRGSEHKVQASQKGHNHSSAPSVDCFADSPVLTGILSFFQRSKHADFYVKSSDF